MHYSITVNVHDQDGLTLAITNTAAVAIPAFTFGGSVNPSSISGERTNTTDATNNNEPDLLGTAAPLSLVTLYATPASGGTPTQIGSGYAQADGDWNILSVSALPTNTYTITATDRYDGMIATATLTPTPLLIDTVGPVITALTFDRADATLTVTFQDNLSGMDMASIEDSAFYHLSARPLAKDVHVLPLILPTSITVTPGATATSPVVATVVFQHGALLRGGSYTVVINSGSGNTGIEDNADNALSGNFYGTFPTGNGRTGGEFLAVINTFHNVVEPFIPAKDGYVPPSLAVIDPPKPAQSHAESGAKRKLHVQPAHSQTPRVAVVRTPANPASTGPDHRTHDKAIESLTDEATEKPRRQ